MAELIDTAGRPLRVERRYRAAEASSRVQAPRPSESANSALEHARGKLRDWGRHLEQNHDLTAQIVRLLARAAANGEVVFMAERRNGEVHEELNRRLSRLWRRWAARADAMETEPLARLFELTAATAYRDGDAFVRHFLGDVRPGRQVNYSLACYEPDFVPFDLTHIDQGRRVVHGVEVDDVGRPVAAWMYREHPSGLEPAASLESMIRVPWAQLSHVARRRRLGQYRGASELAPAILRLSNVDDYEQSEQWAAKVAGSVAVQLTRPLDQSVAGASIDTTYGARTQELTGGLMLDNLAPGEKWEVIDTSRPNPELASFRKSQLRAATAGVGVSYSEATNDYDGSYSSQRQELVTTRSWYRTERAWFQSAVVADVVRHFVTACTLQAAELRLSALFATADPESLFEFEVIPESTPAIDPAKETKAMLDELAAGVESRPGMMRRLGRRPERVDRERASDVMPSMPTGRDGAVEPVEGKADEISE